MWPGPRSGRVEPTSPSPHSTERHHACRSPPRLVGSLPRPMKLQDAYEDLRPGQDHLRGSPEAAGRGGRGLDPAPGRRRASRIVTDGEQRESSFATYPITDTLAGTGLADNLAGDGQFFAIFDDGHHRQLPRLTGGPFRYKTFASEFVEKNKADAVQARQAGGDLAVDDDAAVPARRRDRGLLARAVPDRRDATSARRTSASASRPAPSVSRSTSPRAGWPTRTTRATPGPARTCSRTSSTSTTGCIDRFSAEERKNIGIHTCPGGDYDSVHSKEVPYEKLLSKMFKLNAGYFLIQCASEDDRESGLQARGRALPRRRRRRRRRCASWASSTRSSPEVETPEQVRDAAGAPRPSTSPSSAWGPPTTAASRRSSRDLKPKHGSPGLRPRRRDAEDRRPHRGRTDGVARSSAPSGRCAAPPPT